MPTYPDLDPEDVWGQILKDYIDDNDDLRQPVDSDLTAIAALTTTAFGREFLGLADHAALVAKLALVEADIPSTVAGYFKIDGATLGGTAASIDKTAIPATYKDLYLRVVGRTDAAVTNDTIAFALNNDTTNANYDRQLMSASAAAVTASEVLANTGSRVTGGLPGASSPANHFGVVEFWIFDYASTAHFKIVKTVVSMWGVRTTGGLQVRQMTHGWANTAAVDRITLSPSTGPNFVASTRWDLYGLKGAA